MTHTPTIQDAPADGSGRLDGFTATCPDCGLVMSNTVRSNLEFDIRDHAAYMAAKEAKR